MDVGRCMTPDPIVIAPDTSLDAALELMDDCVVRHLPVVDSGRLVGIVSDRDLLGATGYSVLGGRLMPPPGLTPVEEVMQTELVTVSPDEPIVAAAVEVIVRGIGCLPVVEHGQLRGIVTEMDLLGQYARVCREKRLVGEVDPPVSGVARPNAVVVAPTATLAQVEELCAAKGIRHLPVVQADELVGILSDRDLRRARGAGLSATTPVEQLMTRTVLTVDPRTPLSRAAEMMIEHKVTSLPVRTGASIGIVTSTDILDHATTVLRDPAHEPTDG
jgi:CBS domain-containing protein